MNEHTQERNRRYVSIVKSASANWEIANCMNELTQERNRIHASIKSAFAAYQIEEHTFSSQQQLTVAKSPRGVSFDSGKFHPS